MFGFSMRGLRAQADEAWAQHGHDASEQRFSPLAEIAGANVSRHGLAWALDLPGENALEVSPIEIDGVLHFSCGLDKVYAVSVESCKALWQRGGEMAACQLPQRVPCPSIR